MPKTETGPETAGQPDLTWARDMILVELRREAPHAVGKSDLQERTGLGTDDLRIALSELTEEGAVSALDDGYAWQEAIPAPDDGERDAESPVELPEEEDPGETPPGSGSSPEPPGEPAGAATVGDVAGFVDGVDPIPPDSRYAAVIALQVDFYPELLEGEEPDEAAVREARELCALAKQGITDTHPSLLIHGSVAGVEAFDSPRRVYPEPS